VGQGDIPWSLKNRAVAVDFHMADKWEDTDPSFLDMGMKNVMEGRKEMIQDNLQVGSYDDLDSIEVRLVGSSRGDNLELVEVVVEGWRNALLARATQIYLDYVKGRVDTSTHVMNLGIELLPGDVVVLVQTPLRRLRRRRPQMVKCGVVVLD
jgi:hypothetical protein